MAANFPLGKVVRQVILGGFSKVEICWKLLQNLENSSSSLLLVSSDLTSDTIYLTQKSLSGLVTTHSQMESHPPFHFMLRNKYFFRKDILKLRIIGASAIWWRRNHFPYSRKSVRCNKKWIASMTELTFIFTH